MQTHGTNSSNHKYLFSIFLKSGVIKRANSSLLEIGLYGRLYFTGERVLLANKILSMVVWMWNVLHWFGIKPLGPVYFLVRLFCKSQPHLDEVYMEIMSSYWLFPLHWIAFMILNIPSSTQQNLLNRTLFSLNLSPQESTHICDWSWWW